MMRQQDICTQTTRKGAPVAAGQKAITAYAAVHCTAAHVQAESEGACEDIINMLLPDLPHQWLSHVPSAT